MKIMDTKKSVIAHITYVIYSLVIFFYFLYLMHPKSMEISIDNYKILCRFLISLLCSHCHITNVISTYEQNIDQIQDKKLYITRNIIILAIIIVVAFFLAGKIIEFI